MDQEELDIELIEGYLNKTLTAAELLRFDNRIKTDVSFAEKVDDYKEIIENIKLKGQQDFRNEVAVWENEIKTESETKHIFWKPYLSVAATILIILVAGLYFYSNRNQHKDEQQLFTAYFIPYEDVISVRGNSTQKTALEQAMLLYNEEKYHEAIPYFKTYLSSNKNDLSALFYLTISELGLKNTEEVIPNLHFIITQNSVYHDQAQWYLALTYLMQKDKKSAIQILNTIENDPEHIFKSQAAELLSEIK